MAFENADYDADTIALMREVFEVAWHEVQGRTLNMTADEARCRMAEGILSAVADGERNKVRLKNLALLRAGLR